MTGFTNRQQLLSKMRNGEHLDWDIIVIGGGLGRNGHRTQPLFVNAKAMREIAHERQLRGEANVTARTVAVRPCCKAE